MIKVSVIIPVYNVEKYLEQCLDSIVNQTLQDIEIICINDNSTDNSLRILQEFEAKDSRIIIVNNKINAGAANCRNIGIHIAKGEYLLIFDSDDFCNLNLIELVYTKCKSNNVDLGIYGFTRFDNITKRTITHSLPIVFDELCSGVFSFKDIKDTAFQMFNCGPTTKMYNKQFVINSGIEFQDLKNANDTYFGNMILTQAQRIIYINSDIPLYYYRINVLTQTSNNRDKKPECIFLALLEIKKALEKRKIFSECKKSFFTYALENLIYSLTTVKGNQKEDLFEYYTQYALKEIGMLNCNRRDFLSEQYYISYRNFILGDYCSSQAFGYIDDSSLIAVLDYLKNKKYRCGLWGIGLDGKAFLNACNIYNFKLTCLIDEDINKAGLKIDDYIVDIYTNSINKVDAVIITNPHYSRDIYSKIKNIRPSVKLIDIGAYLRFGLKIEDCIF